MIRTLALAVLALFAAPAVAQHHAFASDRIAVTASGSGPDVVLVPGLTSSPAAFKYVAADVPGYRYHYVQVKGFAGTPAEGNAKGDVTRTVAEEVARYIGEQHLRAPAIVGHSMGGTIALMVAARHPAAVSRVMVVDMPPFMGVFFGGPNATVASVTPVADKLMATMAAAPPEAQRAQQTAMIRSMVNSEAEYPQVLQSAMDSDKAVVASAYRELIVTDLRPELANIAVPVRVLYANKPGGPLTDAQIDAFYPQAYAGLKQASYARIPDSAHFIMYDARPRFTEELRSFLTAR